MQRCSHRCRWQPCWGASPRHSSSPCAVLAYWWVAVAALWVLKADTVIIGHCAVTGALQHWQSTQSGIQGCNRAHSTLRLQRRMHAVACVRITLVLCFVRITCLQQDGFDGLNTLGPEGLRSRVRIQFVDDEGHAEAGVVRNVLCDV